MPAGKQWRCGNVTLGTDDAIDYMLSSEHRGRLLDEFEVDFNCDNTASQALFVYAQDAYYAEAHNYYRRMAERDPELFARIMGIQDAGVKRARSPVSRSAKSPAKRTAGRTTKSSGRKA